MNTNKHYFYEVFKPHNPLKEGFNSIAFDLSMLGRIPLEVFIKRRFGARYLTFSASVVTSISLSFLPIPLIKGIALVQRYSHGSATEFRVFLLHFLSWYILLGIYLYQAWIKRKEIRPKPNEYDYTKFSLYSGELMPWFARLLNRLNIEADLRKRETLIEPLFFFIVGIVLTLLQQYVGVLVVICSNLYSASYVYAWHSGDEFTWDELDKIKLNESIERNFVQYLDTSPTDGVQFRTIRPDSEDLRRKVGKKFVGEDENNYIVS